MKLTHYLMYFYHSIMRRAHRREDTWQTAKFEYHHSRRKYHKGFLILIILLLLFSSQVEADFHSEEMKSIDIADKTLQSTVKIEPELLQHGSGFFVGKNLILTNEHVIRKADLTAKITTYDGRTCKYRVTYQDDVIDIALLETDCEGTPLTLAESVRIGQYAIVAGNPVDLDFTVSSGIISALRWGMIQLDAKVNNGSSGSPVVNLSGEVMGMIKARYDGNPYAAFAIDAKTIKAFLERSK